MTTGTTLQLGPSHPWVEKKHSWCREKAALQRHHLRTALSSKPRVLDQGSCPWGTHNVHGFRAVSLCHSEHRLKGAGIRVCGSARTQDDPKGTDPCKLAAPGPGSCPKRWSRHGHLSHPTQQPENTNSLLTSEAKVILESPVVPFSG